MSQHGFFKLSRNIPSDKTSDKFNHGNFSSLDICINGPELNLGILIISEIILQYTSFKRDVIKALGCCLVVIGNATYLDLVKQFLLWPVVCFTNVSRALQNILSKFMYCKYHTSFDNFKLCMCAQSHGHMYKVSALNSHHKCDFWHCVYLRNYLEKFTNVCETTSRFSRNWQNYCCRFQCVTLTSRKRKCELS